MEMAKRDPHSAAHYVLTIIYVFIRNIFSSVVFLALSAAGYLVWEATVSPYNLLIGLPLMLGGLGLFINNIWSEMLSVFSSTYNKGVCPFCSSR